MGDELKQAAQEVVDHVGQERLARNYNLTSMVIPGDMLRRLAQAVTAEQKPSDDVRTAAKALVSWYERGCPRLDLDAARAYGVLERIAKESGA